MVCPNCGLSLAGAPAQACPRCGYPLYVVPTQTPDYGNAGPPHGNSGQQEFAAPLAPASPAPDYPAQPPVQPDLPFYGQAVPPSYPMYDPQGAPPAYPSGYPSYGQYGPYGQGAPVTTPFYGQVAPPSYPVYGPSMPGAYPPPGWPGAQPQPKRGNGLVIGLSIGIVAVILFAAIAAVAFVQNARNNPPSIVAATPTATNTIKPGKTVLFKDALTSNKNGWTDDDHCSFASGGYHIKGNWICFAPAGTLTDFDLTVHVKQISGPLTHGYGITFRRTSVGNEYVFDIDGDSKWVLYKCVSHSCSQLVDWTSSVSLRGGLNIPHTLEVQASGSHIVCYADGVRLGSVDDGTFLSGKSGLDGSDNIEAVFTDITITSI